jgi:hypothetical protein
MHAMDFALRKLDYGFAIYLSEEATRPTLYLVATMEMAIPW